MQCIPHSKELTDRPEFSKHVQMETVCTSQLNYPSKEVVYLMAWPCLQNKKEDLTRLTKVACQTINVYLQCWPSRLHKFCLSAGQIHQLKLNQLFWEAQGFCWEQYHRFAPWEKWRVCSRLTTTSKSNNFRDDDKSQTTDYIGCRAIIWKDNIMRWPMTRSVWQGRYRLDRGTVSGRCSAPVAAHSREHSYQSSSSGGGSNCCADWWLLRMHANVRAS